MIKRNPLTSERDRTLLEQAQAAAEGSGRWPFCCFPGDSLRFMDTFGSEMNHYTHEELRLMGFGVLLDNGSLMVSAEDQRRLAPLGAEERKRLALRCEVAEALTTETKLLAKEVLEEEEEYPERIFDLSKPYPREGDLTWAKMMETKEEALGREVKEALDEEDPRR